jgi:hypothetical protein
MNDVNPIFLDYLIALLGYFILLAVGFGIWLLVKILKSLANRRSAPRPWTGDLQIMFLEEPNKPCGTHNA